MSRGNNARIRGGEQERKNIVVYHALPENLGYPDPFNFNVGIWDATDRPVQVYAAGKVVDLKTAVTYPTFTFTTPRSRFYLIDIRTYGNTWLWGNMIGGDSYGGSAAEGHMLSFFTRVFVNGSLLTAPVASISSATATYITPGGFGRVVGIRGNEVGNTRAVVFLAAGDKVTVGFNATGFADFVWSGTAGTVRSYLQPYVDIEITELTPEA